MLKGYFDRVMLPGVAFNLPPKSLTTSTTATGLIPGLTNITKIGGVSTYGAQRHVVFYAGDNGRRFLSRGFRPLCAPDCTLTWHGLYNFDSVSKGDKEKFLDEIESSFKFF